MRHGEKTRALPELKAAATLSILGSRDHGALLVVSGLYGRAIQYEIGNPLTAAKMTRHQISAGLYAPVRVLLREDGGGAAFEYDLPASTFGQFGDDKINAAARQLDRDIQSLLNTAAS